MREIKFRGFTEQGVMVTGGIAYNACDAYGMIAPVGIIPEGCYPVSVKPETVAQYTGLKDQNGKGAEMCQGDLVRASGHGIGEVQKNHWGEWVLAFGDSVETIHDLTMEQDLGEIIGTIYENPELLEVVK